MNRRNLGKTEAMGRHVLEALAAGKSVGVYGPNRKAAEALVRRIIARATPLGIPTAGLKALWLGQGGPAEMTLYVDDPPPAEDR